MRLFACLLVLMLCAPTMSSRASEAQDYLYERDIKVPAYQTMREFFDMPNRPGNYEVSLFSDSVGPLTLRVLRVKGPHEHIISKTRSYHVGSHSFQQVFDNPRGVDDLIVEISNSNPAAAAIITIYVVELP